MWIVKLALRRPYTFVVMAILMLVLGAAAIVSMPTDIFPSIDIPVVSVVWAYQRMSPEEMAKRIVTMSERAMTTTVNNIYPASEIDYAVGRPAPLSRDRQHHMDTRPGTRRRLY